MRSISTDYADEPAKSVTAASPIRIDRELRRGYRPRATTIERAREIREIAAHAISRDGVWRFSMLSLAKRMNCLLPTLCYYYKKREDLITDIVLRHLESLRSRTGLAMAASTDETAASELHAFAREYLLVALADKDSHALTTVFPELAGPIDGKAFLACRETLREIVEGRLTAHAPVLAGHPEMAKALSQALLDTLSGASTWLEPYGVLKPAGYAAMVTDWVLDQAARS